MAEIMPLGDAVGELVRDGDTGCDEVVEPPPPTAEELAGLEELLAR